jgi:acyl-CoA synthetase (AMP-forming)/AMP-acid ligase II
VTIESRWRLKGLTGQVKTKSIFADCLEIFGDQIAIISSDGTETSYRQLARLADEVAESFPPEATLIALEFRSDLSSVVTYLAALRARRPIVLLGDVEGVAAMRIVETYRPWIPGMRGCADDLSPHPELAVLLSTSGSTGSAKLVRLSYKNLESNARSIAEFLELDRGSRAISSLSLFYSYGLSILNSHLVVGASMVLTQEPVVSAGFWELFDRSQVTGLAGVPYSYELFERMAIRSRPLPSLKIMTQAGGRLDPGLVSRYAEWAADRGVRFYVMYGQTEATARMAYLPPERAGSDSDCIGVAIPGGSLTLDLDVIGGGIGELIYRGPNVMMGYALERADLARGPEIDALRTGDLAERTDDGLFRIVGRLSRFSKLFGLRISLDDIETYLAARGFEASVAGSDHQITVLVAGPVPAGLVGELADRYGLPRETFVVLAGVETPRLASGKVDYHAIRLAGEAKGPNSAGAAPIADDAQAAVIALFTNYFPGRPVGRDDSFVSLGGDSLNYVNFSIALEDLFGHAPDNWESRTVAELGSLAPVSSPRIRHASLASDVVVRAAAICGVVALHAGISRSRDPVAIAGGAALLMVVFGFNLARFQRESLLSAAPWRILGGFLVRVLAPYLTIVAVYALYKRHVDLASIFLFSNYIGRFHSLLEPFWFIEVMAQCLCFMVVIFAVPAVRALARNRPSWFAIGMLAVAVALKFAGMLVLNEHLLEQRTFEANFLLVAIGWSIHFVRDAVAKSALFALAIGNSIASWGVNDSHVVWTVAGLAALLLAPRVPVPSRVSPVVVQVAAASFFIYLTHLFVIHLIEEGLHISAPVFTTLVALSIGVASYKVFGVLAARPAALVEW